jgi:hypothetical protein
MLSCLPIERRKLRARRAALAVAATRVTTLCVAVLGLAALGFVDAAAQTAERAPATAAAGRELLNSERIAQRFGNYAISVLESDGRVRVSNLYSESSRERSGESFAETSGGRICRTFAVVKYPDRVDSAFAAEHDEIVRGGSIGAVFAAHGWRVGKANLRFFEVEASPRIAELMRVAVGTRLAAHAYALDVTKAGRSIEYALLVEIHHPEYLTIPQLETIYGEADAAGRTTSLEALLATAAEKSAG